MSKLNVLLIYNNTLEKQWLESCINLSGFDAEISAYDRLTPSKFAKLPEEIDILLTSNAQCKKTINALSQYYLPEKLGFPVLIFVQDFKLNTNDKRRDNYADITVDEFPAHLVTPQILSYLIASLLRDFKKDTRLNKLAHYDTLTGATNRVLFNDRLDQALIRSKRFKEPISLIYLDLDKFKLINDEYGHNVGDFLLKMFVAILQKLIRISDTIARIGGDEFNILLPNANSEQAVEIAKKILKEIATPKLILDKTLTIESSIGIVTFSGKQDSSKISTQEIVKKADIAMYEAKHRGRNQYVVYTPELKVK
jgi:diguanylate cyclase (GGDEF)-like protein